MDKTSMQAYCETRLRNMVIKDKNNNPQKINGILKAEILYVLRNYMELKEYDLDIDIRINEKGYYHLVIEADCKSIKSVSYIG